MKQEKTIIITVQGGVVVDVKNLPDGYVVQIVDKDALKRSKTNNRRAVEAIKDAWTSSQPAGSGVLNWRQVGQDTRQRLCWLLCPEGEI